MSDVRLIERWLPIAALSEESVRERRMATALPPINFLHVWWARRPLVASRAAIMASLLPATADRDAFSTVLGIHGDPVKTRRRIDLAKKTGEDLGPDPYGYSRAFTYVPTTSELEKLGLIAGTCPVILDPTAGGGSIPFEASRLRMKTFANDLNPVAAAILRGTVEYPAKFGSELLIVFKELSSTLGDRLKTALAGVYPKEPDGRVDGYLWARTISCPYCSGRVPLSPNWRLAPGNLGIRLVPRCMDGPGSAGRVCDFEIVHTEEQQSAGTISDGDGTCPYPDCRRVIDGADIKRQAQAREMGEQLFAIAFKRRVIKKTKTGKSREGWARSYRTPRPEDDNSAAILSIIEERMPSWLSSGSIPTEPIDEVSNYDRGHRMYGMTEWRDLFNPRQFLGHAIATELYREMVEEDSSKGALTEIRKSAYLYLAFSLDKFRDYNSRQTRWHVQREVMVNTFDSHNFAMRWAYAEMAFAVEGFGYDWVVGQTAESIERICKLVSREGANAGTLFAEKAGAGTEPSIIITCKPADLLDNISDASVDAVVMDPPYGANVMYAELSDFFYVWLKRTAGLVMPELFTRFLTDKVGEAVANKAKFKGQKGADALANRDYQEKMAAIFAESRRVLKPDGIMTVMFTHKDTSAWDALTKGLIEAGFIITASWPVNTEAEGSLHIKDKAAANSTIFLVCRPRLAEQGDDTTYWEDVEPLVAKAVRTRVEEFQKAGIGGVDLYLASFGPALEEFSRHWPLKRGTPRPEPLAKKRRKQAELFEEEFDPYAVTPEDALDAARREVKTWRLNQLTHTKGRGDLDATTSWFVLAWDAFKAPVFSYDEGLRLARAVGADLDGQLIGRICEKKGSDIKLWDSATRAAKSGLGPADGSRAMIDAIHHAAHRARTRTLDAALDLLKDAGIENDPQFLAALEAVLEVLPPSRNFVGFDVATGDAKSAADDFDALEKLRRLAFSDKVDEPQQLSLFVEEAA
ncbi:DUF1156 domain-containing protein [Labrys sp. KNU-23]|nr:DUF1156 domain-containing protein [Labrys sp. KNU-23]